MKKILILAISAIASLGLSAKTAEPIAETSNETILHAWCWSFNTIRENLKDIADAGFTIVQTSPAQHCVTEVSRDKGGGNQLFGKGRWYYQYQPTDWKIGNYQMGTRDDLVRLCEEAKRYGIRIIVDVLPNHTAVDDTRVEDALDAAVGGHDNLYHANGFTAITDYNDRFQCTTGEMGGLPDVDTENPDFQHYYMTYVNDLLACGVRGFRYDTAKHIGLPSDPLDKKDKQNDFWDVATGRKAVKGLRMSVPMDSLFFYGEVLQDKNVKELEYSEYMGLTASNYGFVLRNNLEKASWKADNTMDWCHPANPLKLVTWVESHDTYCNEHISASLTCAQVRMAWVFLAARQYGNPLFYSRPDGSSPENVWGNNIVGARGNDEFKHPEVVAANKFRTRMAGKPETVTFTDNGAVAQVVRGKAGAAVINITNAEQAITMPTTLPNGKYTDAVNGNTFTVKRGVISGTLAPLTSYIIYK